MDLSFCHGGHQHPGRPPQQCLAKQRLGCALRPKPRLMILRSYRFIWFCAWEVWENGQMMQVPRPEIDSMIVEVFVCNSPQAVALLPLMVHCCARVDEMCRDFKAFIILCASLYQGSVF